jgi:hypothetical protein
MMKILSITKMPKRYFDICEARKCPKEAKYLLIIQTKNRDGQNVVEEYSFCDKHIQQLKQEAETIAEYLS